MNIRNADEYDIGLDIGTAYDGWSALSPDGELLKFKGKNTWGARIYESASTAAETRGYRGQRRRYGRRRRRILDLQQFVAGEVNEVDPGFFERLAHSYLVDDDRSFKYIIFNDPEFDDRSYYEQYPTVYHLRKALVESDEKFDIRLVYLALHHAVKYRGNFLIDNPNLSAKDADGKAAIENFAALFGDRCDASGIPFDAELLDIGKLNALLVDSGSKRRDRKDAAKALLGLPREYEKTAAAVANAMFGYDAELSLVFDVEKSPDTKLNLSNEEKCAKFEELLGDDDALLFDALQGVHNSYLLGGILGSGSGTLSSRMVARYEEHKADLAELKRLVRKYHGDPAGGTSKAYRMLFKGPRYADGTYKKNEAKGYTGYIEGSVSSEDLYKSVRGVFKDVEFEPSDAETWNEIVSKMENGTYLQKLRIRDNVAIPHQLHLEEVRAILEKQGEYYPCLSENKEKIEQLVSFRLPYYIGPLGKESNPDREQPFAWAVRKPGHENDPVKPWNFDEVVDRDASAERFITRMTGECSYYYGKKSIPRHSLLYSEFCVRQELNGVGVAADGERFTRMDVDLADRIVDNVFKKKKLVKVQDVREYLKNEEHLFNTAMKGTQKEDRFASSLTSYVDFKRILGRDIESAEDVQMVEEIIAWVTIFEDKDILRRKLKLKYGEEGDGRLDGKQIGKICKLRYTGWSNLSREFLTGLRVEFDGESVSIMDVLRDSRKRTPMVLMEILADKRFGFRDALDDANKDYLEGLNGSVLDQIPCSPAVKKGVNQALKIVDEIVRIAGKPPRKICVEMSRDEVGKGKGRRTTTRYKRLEAIYKAMDSELKAATGVDETEKELKRYADSLGDDRLFLYFLQGGRCIYCDNRLDADRLELYHHDHIVPQSVIKDDSIDNTAMCCPKCNEDKLADYPVPAFIRRRSLKKWKSLRKAGMMSEAKFKKLAEDRPLDRQMKKFINRQLVETRQIIKHVVGILKSMYPDTKVEGVKAELTHNLRVQYGLGKSRALNDYHHAHDAYLACQISRFMEIRYPKLAEDLEYGEFTRYAYVVKAASKGSAGFIVNSFGVSGFDEETGEILRDEWDADAELRRIRKCLAYKDCFISRKTEVQTGKFWSENPRSPREKSGKAVPLKKGLDPDKYGYYRDTNLAYYALIEHTATARGKAKRKVDMVGVPINVSARIGGEDDLKAYLDGLYDDVRILKPRIPKYQKIEWNGAQYYLTSSNEMINANQLWLPAEYSALLDEGQKESKWSELEGADELSLGLYRAICAKIEERYPRYSGVAEKLFSDTTVQRFESFSIEERYDTIDQVLNMLHANPLYGVPSLGLASSLGRMTNINFGSSIRDIVFIDTSTTGMFEKRDRIELGSGL